MATAEQRQRIKGPDLSNVNGLAPLSGVTAIAGVRVYDVGQGDGIAILDQNNEPVLQLDYGGRQGNPFKTDPSETASDRMPIASDRLLMISHWDEDHWCSARQSTTAQAAEWLVPRQITSPRAVKFSAGIKNISCIPAGYVGQGFRFIATNGDSVWWEKIAPGPEVFSREEDCNRTGVAMSIVKAGDPASVILLPGDAPFDRVGHYWKHFDDGVRLRGVVAFHHGAGTHWTQATERLLYDWSDRLDPPRVVFSCADPNAYHHPQKDGYFNNLPGCSYTTTANARKDALPFTDILFTTGPAQRGADRGSD